MQKAKVNGTRFTNDVKKVRIYGGNKRMAWHGEIKKNKKGELKDNFFIEVENGKIKNILDLRVIDQYKIYSKNGKPLSNQIYNEIKIINDQFAIVKQNDKFGVLDIQYGILKIPIQYQWISTKNIYNKIRPFKINNKYGFFDPEFNIMLQAKYDNVKYSYNTNNYFIDDIVPVKLNGKWIFIDNKGKLFINAVFDEVGEYSTKKFIPLYDKKTKIYNFANLITGKFTGVKTYKNYLVNNYNLLNVGRGLTAIYDKNGKLVLNDTYHHIFPLNTEENKPLFLVKNGKKYGIVDKNNATILPIAFYDIEAVYTPDYKLKYFKAKKDRGIFKLFDIEGNQIIPTVVDGEINVLFVDNKTYFRTKIKNINGATTHYLYTKESKEPVFKADYIWHMHKDDKFIRFTINGLDGIIDKNLNVVVEPQKKSISIKGDLFAAYDDGESDIYNIQNPTKKLITLDNRVRFEENYIITYYKRDYSIYDYSFNKINKDRVNHYSICYQNTDTIIIQNRDNSFSIINNEKLINVDENIETMQCSSKYLIAKLQGMVK